jgi:hypothetical protein
LRTFLLLLRNRIRASGVMTSRDAWCLGSECFVPSAEYHLRQAEIAAGLALAQSDPDKAAALNLLALEHYNKADQASTGATAKKAHEPP